MCAMPICNSVLKQKPIAPESLPCLFVRYFLAGIDINLKPGTVQESLDPVSVKMRMS